MEAREKKLKRKIEAAEQIEKDVVHFGLGEGKNQSARKIKDRDECNPPTKKQRSDAKMVEKRTNTVRNESVVMKTRKAKIIYSFKRECFKQCNWESSICSFNFQRSNMHMSRFSNK